MVLHFGSLLGSRLEPYRHPCGHLWTKARMPSFSRRWIKDDSGMSMAVTLWAERAEKATSF